MDKKLRKDSELIVNNAIKACIPEDLVKNKINQLNLCGDIYLVAIGKAAFSMAKAAYETVKIKKGIVITKYNHSKGKIGDLEICEAGHPVLDQNGIDATDKVIKMCTNLKDNDNVLFLISGGGSALFEKPMVELSSLQSINEEMLSKGLNIEEINTIRKRLSLVKGGKFADICKPASVYTIILSDVLKDKLDVIASGPTAKDTANSFKALEIIDKYHLNISDDIKKIIKNEKESDISNVSNNIIGSVSILCDNAKKEAEKLGYKTYLLKNDIDYDVEDLNKYLLSEINNHLNDQCDVALIAGGESTVKIKGNGLGGRNQHLALSFVEELNKYKKKISIISVGSDGTDGPTDAAGGYADYESKEEYLKANVNYDEYLKNNDSYHCLDKINNLIKTGPTGTNVNDVIVILINGNR